MIDAFGMCLAAWAAHLVNVSQVERQCGLAGQGCFVGVSWLAWAGNFGGIDCS